METTRDLVFGVLAVRRSLVDATQLVSAMAEHFQAVRPLPSILVDQGALSPDQCAELNRSLDQLFAVHGQDWQRVMKTIGSGDLELADDQTLDSDVPAPLCVKPLDANAARSPAASRDEGASQDEATVDHVPSGVDRFAATGGGAADRSAAGGAADGGKTTASQVPGDKSLPHTLTMQPASGGVDLTGAIAADGGQQTVEYTPEQCSRYTLTRIHGEGGLGQVWLAIDPNLNREVALKNIRPGKDDQRSRQRLIREAQITGQLEHPNIVPIYELEHASPEATPYYTMRFLRGKTLQEKITRYHQHREKGQAEPLELPELLNAFVDICHAIAYAASRGVMHRDLKPQNIMIGDFGEVLVLDWGLAKRVADEEPEADAPRSPVQMSGEEGPVQTVLGQVMGSPAYMAPEQAMGRVDKMDPRTDIYGLGAILFSILTGKGPHRGERTGNTAKDTRALLRRISEGETPRLRDVDSTIPRALDAICSRAMAKDRDDRYQTATELARDVQRYLADEPVSVYVEPWQQRAWRWIRRHRAWAQAAVAVIVLAMLAGGVAFFFVERARRSEVEARRQVAAAWQAEKVALAETKAAQAEATRRFQQARRTVDESFTGLSDELADYPGAHALRARLLQRAAASYERFAAERSDDPTLRLEFALAQVRLGDVRRLLGEFAESQDAYQQAIARFEQLIAEHDDPGPTAVALAQCYNRLGILHVTNATMPAAGDVTDSLRKAGNAYDAAAAILAKLPATARETYEVRRTAVETQANQGELLRWKSEDQAAIDRLTQVADAFAQLHHGFGKPGDLVDLAKTRISIGELLAKTGQVQESVEVLKQAVASFEQLDLDGTAAEPHVLGLADARMTLANSQMGMGQAANRLSLYEASHNDYLALVKMRPDVPKYRQRAASAAINLVQVLHRMGRNEEAASWAGIAFQVSVDLVNEDQSVAYNHLLEARSALAFGQVLRDQRKLSLAEGYLAAAGEKAAALIGAYPQQVEYLRLRGEVLNNLGATHLVAEDAETARTVLLEARADFEQALTRSPADALTRDGLIWSLIYLGDSLRALDRAAEAKTFYQLALQAHLKQGDETYRQFQLGKFLVDCLDDEFRDPIEAGLIAERIAARYPTNAEYLVLSAAAWYRQGEWARCLDKLEEAAVVQMRGKSGIDFWRAMARWQQDPTGNDAVLAFERAVAQMDKWAPGDLRLLRLRREAATLLGINGPASQSGADDRGEDDADENDADAAAR